MSVFPIIQPRGKRHKIKIYRGESLAELCQIYPNNGQCLLKCLLARNMSKSTKRNNERSQLHSPLERENVLSKVNLCQFAFPRFKRRPVPISSIMALWGGTWDDTFYFVPKFRPTMPLEKIRHQPFCELWEGE